MDWKDILERAAWTFVQAAIGTVTALPLFTDIDGWAAVGAAAGAAGLSAVLSFLKTVAQERLGRFDTRAN